jgi:hypothetical protein
LRLTKSNLFPIRKFMRLLQNSYGLSFHRLQLLSQISYFLVD